MNDVHNSPPSALTVQKEPMASKPSPRSSADPRIQGQTTPVFANMLKNPNFEHNAIEDTSSNQASSPHKFSIGSPLEFLRKLFSRVREAVSRFFGSFQKDKTESPHKSSAKENVSAQTTKAIQEILDSTEDTEEKLGRLKPLILDPRISSEIEQISKAIFSPQNLSQGVILIKAAITKEAQEFSDKNSTDKNALFRGNDMTPKLVRGFFAELLGGQIKSTLSSMSGNTEQNVNTFLTTILKILNNPPEEISDVCNHLRKEVETGTKDGKLANSQVLSALFLRYVNPLLITYSKEQKDRSVEDAIFDTGRCLQWMANETTPTNPDDQKQFSNLLTNLKTTRQEVLDALLRNSE